MRLLAFALLLSACDLAAPARTHAPADSAAGEVAFKLVGPNEAALVVPISINGREPVDFVLDTGATLTCIDVSLARVLGLPEEGPMGGVGIGAMTVGRIETVRMDTLRVGNAVAYDGLMVYGTASRPFPDGERNGLLPSRWLNTDDPTRPGKSLRPIGYSLRIIV